MSQDGYMPVLRDIGTIVRVTSRGGRRVARGVRATASGASTASRWIRRTVGSARRRGGAGNVGMMRLLDLHALSCAGDTLVTVGLAGTIFFAVPTGEARGRVALYLFVTMVPFALLAPVVGPLLDRFRHGRRYALAATMLGRALLAWVIAENLLGFGLYPAAFGILAFSRAYGVARSAAVPRLLPPGMGLSQAGARASVYGTVAGMIVAPIGALAFTIGPQWPLRVASVIFLAGAVVALNLPPRADSDPPEVVPKVFQVPWRQRVVNGDGAPGERVLHGRLVVATLVGGACLRALYGFLLLFLAFTVRETLLPGRPLGIPLGPVGQLSLVGAALAAGTFVATAIGTGLRIRRPARLQAIGVSLVALIGIWATIRFTLGVVVLLCLVTAIASGLGKLAVDASIQERIEETVRASAFAHAETLLMLSWVAGGALGLIPFDSGRTGIGLASLAMVVAAGRAIVVAAQLRGEPLRGRAAPEAASATGRGSTGPRGSADRPGFAARGSTRTRTIPPVPDALFEPVPPAAHPGAGPTRSTDRATAAAVGPAAASANGTLPENRSDGGGERREGVSQPPASGPDVAPPGYHIFRPSPPDAGASDPRTGG